MSGGTMRPPGPGFRRREVQTELAEWLQVGPGCWERRVREWGPGSVPLRDERYGAAEVEKMNEERHEEWLDELRFDAMMEAILEGATDEEVGE
jgi:hypothetical protein